jgi:hypothetical protein
MRQIRFVSYGVFTPYGRFEKSAAKLIFATNPSAQQHVVKRTAPIHTPPTS